MNEQECLSRMKSPSDYRNKPNRGVMQIHITRACDLSCFNCTQGSNLRGPYFHMTPEQFDVACRSLKGYPFTIGVFGGNPAVNPHFEGICDVLLQHFPQEQCGLWCNNPLGKGDVMRRTFNPRRSNLNCHMSQKAYDEFVRDWPETKGTVNLFGHDRDSRHAPAGFVSMIDLGVPEEERWERISDCDVNQKWSAMIGLFRGELRGWFCEIAGAQSIVMQDEVDEDGNYIWPDTGIPIHLDGLSTFHSIEYDFEGCWWELPMRGFQHQVRHHCHNCSVPMRGYGEMALAKYGFEQVSETYKSAFKPKKKDRLVQLVTHRDHLQEGKLQKTTDYLGNATK